MLTLAAAVLWTSVIAGATPSIPRLEMRLGADQGSCSGVVFKVDKDKNAFALTAAHCVAHEPDEKLDITANDRHAEVVLVNGLLDLAIIKFRAHDEVGIPIAAKAPPIGADVAVLGYAFGVSELVAQFGHVAQTFNRETKSTWFDAMTIFGDSGGAVINEAGELVAVTSQIYSGGQLGQMAHIAAAVRIESIADFIDAFEKQTKK